MKLSNKEKEAIDQICFISGESRDKLKNVFESLCAYIVLKYAENEEVEIPFFGSIKLEYKGEKYLDKKKEALIGVKFTPAHSLKKIIGQIEDGEKLDLQKIFLNKISNSLEDYLI